MNRIFRKPYNNSLAKNKYYRNVDYYNNQFTSMPQSYIRDYGPELIALNIEELTKQNNNFRTTLWTGEHLQITLMNINVGESIGLEMHSNLDQFIRIEQGIGLVQMGNYKNNLNFQRKVYDNFAFVIPAGKWHNLINIGNVPIKLYSIYAPPQHSKGTIHMTKQDAAH